MAEREFPIDEEAARRPSGAARGRWQLALGLVLAAAILAWLLSDGSLRSAGVWAALARAPLQVGALALATAVAQTMLSTAKWRELLLRAAPELAAETGWSRLFAYTALANAASQILPAYLAGPLVRGLAMRSRHAGHFGTNAMVAGYEQAFDVAILVVAGAFALVVLLGGGGNGATVVGLAAWVLAWCLVPAVLPAWASPAALLRLVPQRRAFTRRLSERFRNADDAGLMAPRLVGKLMWLSALRYAALALRTVLMGAILLPAVPWHIVAQGFSAVQLSALAAITPGNFGISELGWGAVSAFTDKAQIADLVAFALALRLSGLLASWILAGAAVLIERFRPA